MKGVPAGCPLTQRQLAVLALVAEGKTYQQIGVAIGRNESTIRAHLHEARRRLGVSTSAQAVMLCWRRGWIHVTAGIGTPAGPGDQDIALTPARRLYLHAFELHLKSRTDEEKTATRAILDRALDPMCREQGIVTRGRNKRDLVELLVEQVRRERGR